MDPLKPETLPSLFLDGTRFADDFGRTVLLRGVNLGGDSKVPAAPDGSTHLPTDFSGHREVSFVGRPFPLDEAEEHFARLRGWGFNVVRLLTTWEAVEHAGPGAYDRNYLDYLSRICECAGNFGLYVFIDFHQDVWSRMTGGDGAPCWLFEKTGIDYTKISASGAALVMQHAHDFTDPNPLQKAYPPMCWSSNYRYPACAIMFTLFFGGMTFTPQFSVEGRNVQQYLQEHFLGALRAVATAVKGRGNVIGFDPFNEPSRGWIGFPFSRRITANTDELHAMPGLAFSPLDALMTARGTPVTVPRLGISLLRGKLTAKEKITVNPNRIPLWLPGSSDPFEQAGAWRPGHEGGVEYFNEEFFRNTGGRKHDFNRDFLFPFYERAANVIHSVNPGWFVFLEKDAAETMNDPQLPEPLPRNAVNASHWYDGLTLVFKRFFPVNIDVATRKPAPGITAIRKMYARQIKAITGASALAGTPTLIGEFGIPFDMHKRKAYEKFSRGRRGSGIWKRHILALDLMYRAMDENLVSSTQWNYAAGNRNDPNVGDRWNQEDLSIFSRDQQDNSGDINSGGRALEGFARPFAPRVQGETVSMAFDRGRKLFTVKFIAEPEIEAPTEIFVPAVQFPRGFTVDAPGLITLQSSRPDMLLFLAREKGTAVITVRGR
ncbi:MAG TPA: cellulase family glycosylhydrolase [Spirochaetota bacterium]|nr:cellulase family glycosylhydrolase [Spirochaetota bacterium]HPI89376.1 cellulase family glycosylhydrolase [Spirochaetota bacterium]HPR49910.1 cellulase family glycosylhydrolase [Spirochaetota bacterium]